METKERIDLIVAWLRKRIHGRKLVVGISGGVDSSVVAALSVLSKDNKPTDVYGVLMPYGDQSVDDGLRLAKLFGITYAVVDIKPAVDMTVKSLNCLFTFAPDAPDEKCRLVLANLKARERMKCLYAVSNYLDGMVVGTGNKTEIELGYFTKYGDGGVDLEPLGDCYKLEVVAMAEVLGIPHDLAHKTPSAELWADQTDEDELGAPYANLDMMVAAIVAGRPRSDCDDLSDVGISQEVRCELMFRYFNSAHKREMPPICALNS